MSEAKMWDRLRVGMGHRWVAERIENKLNAGTPDVTYAIRMGAFGANGWVELKYLRRLTDDESEEVEVPLYKPEQRNWIRRHGQGGYVFLLLQAADTWFLFNWINAQKVGAMTLGEMKERNLLSDTKPCNRMWDQLQRALIFEHTEPLTPSNRGVPWSYRQPSGK